MVTNSRDSFPPKAAGINRLTVAYIALLHVVLGGILWKSDFLDSIKYRLGLAVPALQPELTDYYHQVLNYHSLSVDIVPDESVIFIGDSITQSLTVSAVYPLSVNYGIGGDTTNGVLERLPVYRPALERAKYIVVAIGINDTYHRNSDEAIENYVQILDNLPQDRPVIVSAVLPVDDSVNEKKLSPRIEWRKKFNRELERLADERSLVTFVDGGIGLDTDGDGRLDGDLHDGAGVHLNSAGNLIWAENLRNAILRLETAAQS